MVLSVMAVMMMTMTIKRSTEGECEQIRRGNAAQDSSHAEPLDGLEAPPYPEVTAWTSSLNSTAAPTVPIAATCDAELPPRPQWSPGRSSRG